MERRISEERRDLLGDADDKRDKGGDEGAAWGGGLIKRKARRGEALVAESSPSSASSAS